MKILLIEDDSKTARAVTAGLNSEDFETVWAKTGEEGFYLLSASTFDALILDWMLPGHTGIEILKTLRGRGDRTPVLLLTARDTVEDRVAGLNTGADDYLVKPFAFAELLARLRALLRRSGLKESNGTQVADLMIDLQRRRVTRGKKEVDLTPREFDLLAYLMSQHGQIVTREMLAREVWRVENRATPLDNVIDVHIAHLRRKIDAESDRKLIQTVRGVGFVLQPEES